MTRPEAVLSIGLASCSDPWRRLQPLRFWTSNSSLYHAPSTPLSWGGVWGMMNPTLQRILTSAPSYPVIIGAGTGAWWAPPWQRILTLHPLPCHIGAGTGAWWAPPCKESLHCTLYPVILGRGLGHDEPHPAEESLHWTLYPVILGRGLGHDEPHPAKNPYIAPSTLSYWGGDWGMMSPTLQRILTLHPLPCHIGAGTGAWWAPPCKESLHCTLYPVILGRGLGHDEPHPAKNPYIAPSTLSYWGGDWGMMSPTLQRILTLHPLPCHIGAGTGAWWAPPCKESLHCTLYPVILGRGLGHDEPHPAKNPYIAPSTLSYWGGDWGMMSPTLQRILTLHPLPCHIGAGTGAWWAPPCKESLPCTIYPVVYGRGLGRDKLHPAQEALYGLEWQVQELGHGRAHPGPR